MRVLLVNTNRKYDLLAAPPLGLCYVAAAAEAAGHQVHILDLCFAPKNIRKTIRNNLSNRSNLRLSVYRLEISIM